MGDTLRVGVVGAGIGAGYIAGFQKQEDVEVVALAARTLSRAGPLAKRYRIPHVYTGLREMLDKQSPDIVVIATPNNLHHPMTLEALEAGAHVLCDKPLAMNTAQAQDMAERADALGRKHFVPFVLRFLPAGLYMREILDTGFVGRILSVNVRYYVQSWGDLFGPMRWQYDMEQAGSGTLGNIGSHAIHLVQWWVGSIHRVCAMMSTAVPERKWPDGSIAHVEVDDVCAFIGEMDGGVPLVFNTSSVALVPRARTEIDIFGTEGSLTFQQDWSADFALTGAVMAMRRSDLIPVRVDLPERLTGEFIDLPDYYTPVRGNFTRMTGEFVSAIREDRPASPNFHDGLKVQQVIDAVIHSVRTGGWVDVPGTK